MVLLMECNRNDYYFQVFVYMKRYQQPTHKIQFICHLQCWDFVCKRRLLCNSICCICLAYVEPRANIRYQRVRDLAPLTTNDWPSIYVWRLIWNWHWFPFCKVFRWNLLLLYCFFLNEHFANNIIYYVMCQ